MYHDLDELLAKLSTRDHLLMTEEDCDLVGLYVHSDGCTSAIQFFKSECKKHDFRYRTHRDFYGKETTKKETDLEFRRGIQYKSRMFQNSRFKVLRIVGFWIGWLSPLAWIRWFCVWAFGKRAWENHHFCRP